MPQLPEATALPFQAERSDKYMISCARKWRPLHVAIAWELTQDEEFSSEIAGDENAEQLTFWASSRLEQEMMKAGCFEAVNETIPLDPPSRALVIIRQRLKSGYVGRFRELAEAYENGGNATYTSTVKALPHSHESACGIVSLSDFLLGRWHDAFHSIANRIADGTFGPAVSPSTVQSVYRTGICRRLV